jgi:hypothetical protein
MPLAPEQLWLGPAGPATRKPRGAGGPLGPWNGTCDGSLGKANAMTLPPVADLAVFMALVLVFALYGLAVSGQFPAEFRTPALQSNAGRIILWATLAIWVGATACALMLAWRRLPLYAAVIGGGAMILLAPLLLQPMPDSFVNGRQGLLALAALGLALALLAANFIA